MHQTLPSQEKTVSGPKRAPHVIGDSPGVLFRIIDSGVNLCLWQRATQAAISRELAFLQASALPDVRCQTSLDTFDDDVCTLMQQQALDPMSFTQWRIDMERLAGLYFGVSEQREVTLRLVTTDDDDCRRFHFDRSNLRLLCTYRGPGTEWLTDEQVDRLAQSAGAANEDIVRFGEPARFETFWAGILKGEAYPGNAGNGLIHRSPAIAYSGQTRVLFSLDC